MQQDRSIESFSSWKDSFEEISGMSRQFSHLTGLSMSVKNIEATKDGSTVVTFSVRPKPLKWKGTNGWNRVEVKMKSDGTFLAIVGNNNIIGFKPGIQWAPIRKAMDVMEKVKERLKKADTNEG